MRVSKSLSGAVRQFSYWVAHGTVGYPLLEGLDYISAMQEESSFMEQAYAVFMNNLELDENGNVLNYKHAEKRASQYIRSYFDEEYIVSPPFEEWECELYPVSDESYTGYSRG
ncbi:MAG: hypothetical protein NC177_02320 [Ruminococcus flavefaciens]|nr:hypothetical protein [Ruminococcus flavefaciens]